MPLSFDMPLEALYSYQGINPLNPIRRLQQNHLP